MHLLSPVLTKKKKNMQMVIYSGFILFLMTIYQLYLVTLLLLLQKENCSCMEFAKKNLILLISLFYTAILNYRYVFHKVYLVLVTGMKFPYGLPM